MGTMRDFWVRERLLRHIGERHDTDDVSRMIHIQKPQDIWTRAAN